VKLTVKYGQIRDLETEHLRRTWRRLRNSLAHCCESPAVLGADARRQVQARRVERTGGRGRAMTPVALHPPNRAFGCGNETSVKRLSAQLEKR
jgi:hypothetical protein